MNFNFKQTGIYFSLFLCAFTAGNVLFSQNIISAEENYARNRPGVVKVQTEFSANVYVNKVQMN